MKMCNGLVTFVKTTRDETVTFPITIGLHHGYAPSLYLFAFSYELTCHAYTRSKTIYVR